MLLFIKSKFFLFQDAYTGISLFPKIFSVLWANVKSTMHGVAIYTNGLSTIRIHALYLKMLDHPY